uniref:Uncharacterized protein n=1 Tax=Oryza brachyantha TaxID=4533 RepID=J3M6S1_ORYBR
MEVKRSNQIAYSAHVTPPSPVFNSPQERIIGLINNDYLLAHPKHILRTDQLRVNPHV